MHLPLPWLAEFGRHSAVQWLMQANACTHTCQAHKDFLPVSLTYFCTFLLKAPVGELCQVLSVVGIRGHCQHFVWSTGTSCVDTCDIYMEVYTVLLYNPCACVRQSVAGSLWLCIRSTLPLEQLDVV